MVQSVPMQSALSHCSTVADRDPRLTLEDEGDVETNGNGLGTERGSWLCTKCRYDACIVACASCESRSCRAVRCGAVRCGLYGWRGWAVTSRHFSPSCCAVCGRGCVGGDFSCRAAQDGYAGNLSRFAHSTRLPSPTIRLLLLRCVAEPFVRGCWLHSSLFQTLRCR
jgi:hypothetical protein